MHLCYCRLQNITYWPQIVQWHTVHQILLKSRNMLIQFAIVKVWDIFQRLANTQPQYFLFHIEMWALLFCLSCRSILNFPLYDLASFGNGPQSVQHIAYSLPCHWALWVQLSLGQTSLQSSVTLHLMDINCLPPDLFAVTRPWLWCHVCKVVWWPMAHRHSGKTSLKSYSGDQSHRFIPPMRLITYIETFWTVSLTLKR